MDVNECQTNLRMSNFAAIITPLMAYSTILKITFYILQTKNEQNKKNSNAIYKLMERDGERETVGRETAWNLSRVTMSVSDPFLIACCQR